MKVEIWSDLVCPFCYIGKRKFEHALKQLKHQDDIKVRWRSFELSPDVKPDPSDNTYEHLAKKKGWTLEHSKQIHNQLTKTAKEAGLEFHFDTAVPANTFNAHRLSHLAGDHDLQDTVEERLFRAYFTDGEDIGDDGTLIKLGVDAGLPEDEIREMLKGDLYAVEVQEDKDAAGKAGVRGVPYFVFNEKYSISGAQPSDLFLATLQKAYKEFKQQNTPDALTNAVEGTCSADGNC